MAQAQSICVFLCGDVMTGRGIDQVLPCPSNPVLYESCVRDARVYVEFAEQTSGPICRPVGFEYIWGDALPELRDPAVDVRVINLETSVTRSDNPWPGKAIHYRMHPGNVGCITAAGIDCCCLGNNHMLDWGHSGLAETLQTLDHAHVMRCGAGCNEAEAASPAVINVPGKGGVVVFSLGSPTSGIPWEWSASEVRPGVNVLDLSDDSARRMAGEVRRVKQPGDVVIASVHWGGNWGYHVPREQIRFARRLIEEGVDIVHGHSSHHFKASEFYRNRLVLYGCGDFLDDYEGISGHEEYRNDLKLMYVPKVDPLDGRLLELRLIPMQVRRFRLNRAAAADAKWIADLLSREGMPFGTRARLESDHSITLHGR